MKVIPFMVFLAVMMTFFTIIYTILGENFGSQENILDGFNLFLNVFAISIGNITAPLFPFWNQMIKLNENKIISYISIYSIQIVWLTH
jgi:hypothetical protein